MGILTLLADIEASGFRLSRVGEKFRLTGRGPRPTELMNRLAPHRSELLTHLRQTEGITLQDVQEAFKERAAIAEHDGGLPRHEAKALAQRRTDLLIHRRGGIQLDSLPPEAQGPVKIVLDAFPGSKIAAFGKRAES